MWRSFLNIGAKKEAAKNRQVAADARIYAIGDIHGCYDLMQKLVQEIRDDAASFDDDRQTQLVFLGDYVDRGDQSRKVLQSCIELDADPTLSCVFLRGNHEVAMMNFVSGGDAGGTWINMGGRQTLFSFGIKSAPVTEASDDLQPIVDEFSSGIAPFRTFLGSLKDTYQSGDVVFVHAALNPDKPLDKQRTKDLHWGTSQFLTCDPWSNIRVVHGHYADVEPVVLAHRVCVDSGAFYTGRLSAIRLDDEDKIISVGH